jgi:hypothetical protein
MKITYKTLLALLKRMTDEQLDCDVTIYDDVADEYMAGELLICGPSHGVLDDGHPYLRMTDQKSIRVNNVNAVAEQIGL